MPPSKSTKSKPSSRKSAASIRKSSGKSSKSTPKTLPAEGRERAIIDAVRPVVDGGRFPAKRIVGEACRVEADVFTDGHERLTCLLQFRATGARKWTELPMEEHPNDLWSATFAPTRTGSWDYRVVAWVDHFVTWQSDLRKRVDAGQDVGVDLQIGADLIKESAAETGRSALRKKLEGWADRLTGKGTEAERAAAALSEDLARAMSEAAPRRFASESPVLKLDVDRPKALFSTWYELFPRSTSPDPERHGTFKDVIARLPYVAEMGFDVLYLPPIHPIGDTKRKGRNNQEDAEAWDVGSPWAIGGPDGGHDAIHPELGTLKDFDKLVKAADKHGMELALDLAFQCSPDHPYVKDHPEWFRHRPDGSIQYAENPPKKYQDIYPIHFECDDWKNLWNELLRVTLFWVERGVRIFRVDNPHTKPFPFWEWMIAEVRSTHPDVLFLAEAFTRPKKMYRLAKAGFSQSYTYFSWRYTAHELRTYVEELASSPTGDLFRPNFWPNTPDILTEQLQHGGRPAAMARLVLAATLSSSYGIYGPLYELCDFTPREPGSEESLDSEKYQLRNWNLADPFSLSHFIARVNRIRKENPALHQYRDVTFHHCDNHHHLAYSKRDATGENIILCVVNTDPHDQQWGTVRLDLGALGLPGDATFGLDDLLGGGSYEWQGPDNLVGLEPGVSHLFRVRSATHSEEQFETFA